MRVENNLPTRGQLERQLSQALQSLYRDQFGHSPTKFICHIFGDKVAIVVENAVTFIEKLLLQNSQLDLAGNVRSAVDKIFTSQVKAKVKEILNVEVAEIIGNSCLQSEYIGMIVILETQPEIRYARKNNGNKAKVQSENTIF